MPYWGDSSPVIVLWFAWPLLPSEEVSGSPLSASNVSAGQTTRHLKMRYSKQHFPRVPLGWLLTNILLPPSLEVVYPLFYPAISVVERNLLLFKDY